MKKQFYVIAATVLILMAACSAKESQLKDYAQHYLEAMGNYKPADAQPYVTPETANATIKFFLMLMEHTDPAVYRNNMPAEITLGQIEYTNDTCAIVSFHKSTPSTQQDGKLHMVKRKGKWLVHEVIDPTPITNLTNQKTRTLSEEEKEALRNNYSPKRKHNAKKSE